MTTTITKRVTAAASGGQSARVTPRYYLLLEGDEEGRLLLEGDMQADTDDALEIEGDMQSPGGTTTKRVTLA